MTVNIINEYIKIVKKQINEYMKLVFDNKFKKKYCDSYTEKYIKVRYYNFYEDASKAYLNGDYDATIAALNTIVINSVNVWDVTYHRLGLAYLARGASEEDFKIRGHGDLFGTKQSGDMTFKIADIKEDYKILLQAKKDSMEFLLNNKEEELKEKIINGIKEG